MTGNNSFDGGSTIENGTLSITSQIGLGAAESQVSFTGGTLAVQGSTDLPWILTATTSGDVRIDVADRVAATIRSTGTVTGDGALVKIGNGILVLKNPVDHTGDVDILDGFLDINESSERIADTTALNVAAGGFLRLFNGVTETVGSLAGNGTVLFQSSTGHHLRVGGNDRDTTFSGQIFAQTGGDGALSKIGTGTFTLTGANTYTEGTTIDAGVLQVGDGGTTGSILGDVTNNASLVFNRSNDLAFAGAISGPGSVTKQGAGALTLSGASTYSGGTTLVEGAIVVTGNSNLGADSAPLTFQGGVLQAENPPLISFTHPLVTDGADAVIDLRVGAIRLMGGVTGDGGFVKNGPGELVVQTTASSYGGSTTLNAGVMQIQMSEVLPDDTDLIVNDGASFTLFFGFTETVGSLSGNGAVSFGASGNHLIVGHNNSSTVFSGGIAGGGRLTKIGGGTLALTGANTYGGGTTIDGGTLLANNTAGSATGAGGVTINGGGTLGGTGSAAGSTTVNDGGTAAPGASVGVLTLDDVLFDAGSFFDVELAGAAGVAGVDFDALIVNDTATINPGSTLNIEYLNAFVASPGDSFLILDASTVTGTFDTINFPDGQVWFTVYDPLAGTLSVGVVPEPATLFMLAIVAGGASQRRRHGVSRRIRTR